MAGRARKLPSREEVVRLYVEEGLGTPQIARMFGLSDPHGVRLQLLRAGIKLRRKTVRAKCVECGKPVVRTWHAKFKTWYGNRCKDHQKAHRKQVCSDWAKRFRETHPALVKERFARWVNRLRSMNFSELYQEIKEKPCKFKKEELLRKLRKLNRMGRSEEAIKLAVKAFPMPRPKRV